MAAELSADDGAGSGESVPRHKKWDITSHKGYTQWALGLGAYISANGSVRAFRGIDAIDDASITAAHAVAWAEAAHNRGAVRPGRRLRLPGLPVQVPGLPRAALPRVRRL